MPTALPINGTIIAALKINKMEPQSTQQNSSEQPIVTPTPQAPQGGDVGTHKALAILGYIFPVLFFVPLLSEEGKKSNFAMFHANQHLVLLVAWLVSSFLTFILIGFIMYVFCIVVTITGIMSAAAGTMKPMPLIGKISLLK